MIDLDYTRERMLADIHAAGDAAPLSGLSDSRSLREFVERAEARLVARIGAPGEILPEVEAALAARFPAVTAERLRRNLLLPLKKALGNAHKRGNRLDPEKCITLELVVTQAGAFAQVSDQGEGFDVAGTWARFRDGTPYFTHGGSGFRKFAKARAVVSFADGGRTFRTRYLAAEPA